MESAAKMVWFPRKAGYLEARRMASEKGLQLPSNVLHDDILVRSARWKGMWDFYPAWARELAVYPVKHGMFQRGFDVIDSESGWIFPASYLPAEALDRMGAGLLVDPADISVEKAGTIVHPASVRILHPFIQENGGCGRLERETRIPLDLRPRSGRESRRFYRAEGAGVRPIARSICSMEDDYWRKGVSGLYGPKSLFGVAGVGPGEPPLGSC